MKESNIDYRELYKKAKIDNQKLIILVRKAIFKGADIGAYAEDLTDAENKCEKWLKQNLDTN